MKYKTVHIKPHEKNDWKVSFQIDNQDRIDKETYPHSLGFFHYPETMGDEEAFQKLKWHLIGICKQDIKNLQKSLDELINLESGLKEK